MRIHPSDAARLKFLNQARSQNSWKKVTEKRQCILCQRSFTGRQAVIRWARKGVVNLTCPTPECESNPHLWVRPGNPLTNEGVWLEWELAMAAALAEDGALQSAV